MTDDFERVEARLVPLAEEVPEEHVPFYRLRLFIGLLLIIMVSFVAVPYDAGLGLRLLIGGLIGYPVGWLLMRF